MSFMRSSLAAAIFGFLTQMGASSSQSPPDRSAPAVAEAAVNLFESIRSEVANALQVRLKSREISSRDLSGIVVLLDSSKAKLQEAKFDEKLTRASKQVELAHTQAQAVLTDP